MPDTIVVCATSRLAKTIRETPPANTASTVWDTPIALTIEDWLGQLAEEAMLCGVIPPRILIDSCGEQMLWEKVIAEALAMDARPLFDIPSLSASAREAHQLMTVWSLPQTTDYFSEEARLFMAWRQDWLGRLEEADWSTALTQQLEVIKALENGALVLPSKVVFAGFDQYTPLQQRLRDALNDRGVILAERSGLLDAESVAAAHAFADTAAQCRAIARWTRETLMQSPDARLGIIAPNLSNVRDRLERELDNALHPHLNTPALAEAPRMYNFSLGKPLDQTPVVATALALLSLAVRPHQIAQRELSALLLNPYWSAAELEADGRARLDARMRKGQPFYTSVGALARLAQTSSDSRNGTMLCPLLAAHLAGFAHAIEHADTAVKLPSDWVGAFRTWLSQLHWAAATNTGARALSSHEFQAKEAWNAVLDQFGTLDGILGPIDVARAVARLRHLCQNRVFQPQTHGRPAVQVLGMLESAGLRFDAVWVMDMNDHVWPALANANPLLPLQVQRQHKVPNASAAIQLQHAQDILARLRRQAPVLHYSFVHMEEGRELRPSPLIAGIMLSEVHSQIATESDRTPPLTLQRMQDTTGPAVQEGEKVKGGTGALRAQAICPAWAFFQFRLGASALDSPAEGLDMKGRGILVHGALEAFWKKLKSSAELRKLSPSALAGEVRQAVEESLTAHEKGTSVIPPRFRELEHARLCRLVADWLAVERKRPDFTVIECERRVALTLEGIELNMQIDRVDQQGDHQIIVDYKTGRDIDSSNWATNRLSEPQLPIYAVQLSNGQRPGPVGAVVFAKVRIGEMQFGGIAVDDGILPEVKGLHKGRQQKYDKIAIPDWGALIGHWEKSLNAIAVELRQGEAGVFYSKEALLQYCDVKPILRLPERAEQFERQAAQTAANLATTS